MCNIKLRPFIFLTIIQQSAMFAYSSTCTGGPMLGVLFTVYANIHYTCTGVHKHYISHALGVLYWGTFYHTYKHTLYMHKSTHASYNTCTGTHAICNTCTGGPVLGYFLPYMQTHITLALGYICNK